MALVYVGFDTPEKTKVTSVFGGPQDIDVYPSQGQLEDTDARYLAFISPVLEPETLYPIEKLIKFLRDNPDVAEIIG